MGSHAVDRLLDAGHEVVAADSLVGGYRRNVHDSVRFEVCDLADRAAAAKLIEAVHPEIIFHYAADATEGRSQFTPLSAMDNNIAAYLNTLVPAIDLGLKKMVLVSSMSVYGAQEPPFDESMPRLPEDVYGAMKASMETATEHLAQVHGFDYAIFRPHNVYGERQNMADPYRNVVAIFINNVLRQRSFYIYGDGQQMRAFSYIGDITPTIVDGGLSEKSNGMVFNVGSDEPHTIEELAEMVRRAFFGEQDWPDGTEPTYVPDRPLEVKNAYCSHERAVEVLGFSNRMALQEGVDRMVRWAQEFGPQEPAYLSEQLEVGHDRAPVTWRERLI